MNTDYQLCFELLGDWHIGNGKEAGAYADALVLKDQNGLPYLPGKSVKGLLRQAFTTARDNHWFESQNDDPVSLLFGDASRAGVEAQGLIQVSSATLADGEVAYFNNRPEAKSHLYRVIASTAIEHETGVARETSLRTMEVTIPVTLTATLNLNLNHPACCADDSGLAKNFGTWLAQVVTLITAVGAKRHRGLGKVIVTAQPFGREQK